MRYILWAGWRSSHSSRLSFHFFVGLNPRPWGWHLSQGLPKVCMSWDDVNATNSLKTKCHTAEMLYDEFWWHITYKCSLKSAHCYLLVCAPPEHSIRWRSSPPVSRCCMKMKSWAARRLIWPHQDIHLCACVWLSRGSVTDGKCMIHADVPGWCSGRQRSILLLGAFSHQRAFVAKWNIYTHRSNDKHTL